MKVMTDLALKVGGVLALLGCFAGAFVFGNTTCTSSLIEPKTCTNVFGEVALDAFGNPHTAQLMTTGALVGAVTGAILGVTIARLMPHTRDDLF